MQFSYVSLCYDVSLSHERNKSVVTGHLLGVDGRPGYRCDRHSSGGALKSILAFSYSELREFGLAEDTVVVPGTRFISKFRLCLHRF